MTFLGANSQNLHAISVKISRYNKYHCLYQGRYQISFLGSWFFFLWHCYLSRRARKKNANVVQGFYLTHPPPVIPDYQTPRSREISDYLEPVNSAPYEEIEEHFAHSTQETPTPATTTEPGHDDYEPMPDLQPADQKVRYENVAERNHRYENAGFTPDTAPGTYEFTPGGYEELKKVENKAKKSFQSKDDSLNEDYSITYDVGYEPASSHSTTLGTPVLSSAQYEKLKRVQ